MQDFILKYWVRALFGVVVAGMAAVCRRLSKKVKKQMCDQKSLRDGTQALLRNEIIRDYDKYMERGYVPIYARESILSMYEAYHALGGNGTITQLIEELKELPSKNIERGTYHEIS